MIEQKNGVFYGKPNARRKNDSESIESSQAVKPKERPFNDPHARITVVISCELCKKQLVFLTSVVFLGVSTC